MSTTERTDVHRPVNLDPGDYDYLYAGDSQAPGFLRNVDLDWWRSITRWDPALAYRSIHQCHHCGARIRYFAILFHRPSGHNVAVGETCLDNRFGASKADFQRLRKAAALDRQKQRIKTAAREFVEALDPAVRPALDRDVDIETLIVTDGARRVLKDLRHSLWNRYGSLTDKQVDFAARLVAEGPAAVEAARKRQEERDSEVHAQAPEGRLQIEGTVVSRKARDTDWGLVYKLTIKVDTGDGVWLAWVSEPSRLDTKVGDTVRLTATFARSDTDEHFAFGKRPSKAEVLS
jgi:hypothetical protein